MTEINRTGTRFDTNEEYQIVSYIGSGKTAAIYLLKSAEVFYVLKVANENSEKGIELIRREAKAMEDMVEAGRQFRLIECFDDSDLMDGELPWLIMDYIPGITLNDLLEAIRGCQETPQYELKPLLKYKIIYAIAKELELFHGNGLVHRDIKPDNIFIDSQFIPHIGDLGDASNHSVTTIQHGTVNFIPPEAIVRPGECIDCPPPYDVFEFAGVLLQILTFEWPYSDMITPDKKPDKDAIELRIKNGDIDDRFEPGGELDDQLLPSDRILYDNIIKNCWKYDSSQRPTMGEIIQMIREAAAENLNSVDINKFEDFIESLESQLEKPLGHEENVQKAIENGFHLLLDETSPLKYAARCIGINIDDYTESIIDALGDTLYLSERSNPHIKR